MRGDDHPFLPERMPAFLPLVDTAHCATSSIHDVLFCSVTENAFRSIVSFSLGRYVPTPAILAGCSIRRVACFIDAVAGESPTLTDDEKLLLWSAAVDEVGERATVIASTGTYSTAHSVHLTERAHELGVDGFLVVTPYYNKPPPRGIVEHFKAIAAASDKPIIVYNIPQRVVVNIEPETITRLAEIENVRAVKQANDDLAQARHIVATGLDLYAGDDNLFLPFLELGGVGGICVHTHVVGPQVAEQVRAVREGDLQRAREIDRELAPVYDLLKITTNPIPIKAALNLIGHEVGNCRLPLVPPTREELAQVRDCLARLGLLVAA